MRCRFALLTFRKLKDLEIILIDTRIQDLFDVKFSKPNFAAVNDLLDILGSFCSVCMSHSTDKGISKYCIPIFISYIDTTTKTH